MASIMVIAFFGHTHPLYHCLDIPKRLPPDITLLSNYETANEKMYINAFQ